MKQRMIIAHHHITHTALMLDTDQKLSYINTRDFLLLCLLIIIALTVTFIFNISVGGRDLNLPKRRV